MATPKSNINKTIAKWSIDAVWHALEELSHKHTLPEGFWRTLNAATERTEREHRKWLHGTWREHHPRAVSVATAARYFAAIAPFREFEAPRSWMQVAGIREDWIMGHALREWWTEAKQWEGVVSRDGLKKSIEILQALDYGEHLVR